jgi:RNA polymerase sigma factor (TIGR02999 family)
MKEITRILSAIEQGDPKAAEQILPLVYNELRKLAAGHMANEKAGHTLDATALVHEAYLRMVGPTGSRDYANRRHFFAAAAEAMRRILIDHARQKQAVKRGGQAAAAHINLDQVPAPSEEDDQRLDLDAALTAFANIDAGAAELAKLRVFGGLSVEEAAEVLEIPRATAFRTWTYARAWLTAALSDRSADS